MSQTLLEIIQDVAVELGNVQEPLGAASSTDETVKQLVAFANAHGKELSRTFPWQSLQREHTLTTTTDTTYSLPTDYLWMLPQTQWDRSSSWMLQGPINPQGWQFIQSGIVVGGPRTRYRINQSLLEIDPAQSGKELVFNYITKNWVVAEDSTAKAKFTADTDTCLFDDRLMVLGIKLRWLRQKGLDTFDAEQEYMSHLSLCKFHDNSAPVLRTNRHQQFFISNYNIPEGNW